MKSWYSWSFKNWIYIFVENPFKTMNKLKGVFKPLKMKFWFGNPFYVPLMFAGTHGKLFDLRVQDVMWKDKFDTPRFEECPFIRISLFNKFCFLWYWTFENQMEDNDYWEQALWYLYYYNTTSCGRLSKPDIQAAIESWPWENWDTEESSWNNKYLV